MADVFVSYSRADRAVAERLVAALEAIGVSSWMDSHLASGTTFAKVTEEELNKAGKVIVLWSKTSIESGWVCDEAQAGREQGKLVPLTIDGSQPPMGFRQIQTTDISDWARGKSDALPRELLHGLGHAAPARESVGRGPATPKSSRRTLVMVAAAALLLAVLGALYLAFGRDGRSGIAQAQGQIPVLVRGFTAYGGDEENTALAGGITDELVLRLRRVKDLQIATSLPDGGAPSELFEHAHAIEGSIRRSGEDLRTTIRLLDPDGTVLWSETFDRTINELLQVQEETAFAIANALSVSLDVGANSTAYGGTSNSEAYAQYVLGVAIDGSAESTVHYERAVELDPNYTQAWSALMNAYLNTALDAPSDGLAEGYLRKAREASDRAFHSEPRTMYSYLARGVLLLGEKDYVGAEEMLRAVAENDPGFDPLAKAIQANLQISFGRIAKAERLAALAAQIDPVYKDHPSLVYFSYLAGRHEEAIARFERLPGTAIPQTLISVYGAKLASGDRDGARRFAQEHLPAFAQARRLYETTPDILTMSVGELRTWTPANWRSGRVLLLIDLARHAAMDGENAAALRLLEAASERPNAGRIVASSLWSPPFASLRGMQAFERLVEKLGLVAAWRQSGEWGDFCRPVSATGFECS